MSGAGLLSLAQLPLGAAAEVDELPSGPLRARLASLGLVTGAIVELLQRQPLTVVRVGATTLALEREIGAQILVRMTL